MPKPSAATRMSRREALAALREFAEEWSRSRFTSRLAMLELGLVLRRVYLRFDQQRAIELGGL